MGFTGLTLVVQEKYLNSWLNTPILYPVTKTFLPPLPAYNAFLQKAWDKQWLTNRGDLVQELEHKIQDIYRTPGIIAMCNGTLPLHIAIKALSLKGDIITTPFSYIATSAAIVWENCNPKFVDIQPDTFSINEALVEAAIDHNTVAILATHVFGNPCNIPVLEAIAIKHSLPLLFDAAHCFGVQYQSRSVFSYGDVSTCSFHATKLFHTGEGGALFCKHKARFDTFYQYHNFGHKGYEAFHSLGTNAKMSELNAALGLAILPYVDGLIAERKKLVETYINELQGCNIRFMQLRDNTQWNYAYMPVVLENEAALLALIAVLHTNNIFPRRYFYPSLHTINYLRGTSMPVSEQIASSILCLPLYNGLSVEDVQHICNIIKSGQIC